MSAIDRLYSINNRTTKKSVNIDDSLYKKLINFTQNKFHRISLMLLLAI